MKNNLKLNPPFFYGWIIVFIGSLGLFFSGPGQTYSISVFIDAYLEDFGWSRTMISSLYSTATLLSGLTLMFVGRLIDRLGQRFMLVATGVLLGFASFWNSMITGPIMLFIGFYMLRLFGQGTMTLVSNTLVPQWFIVKRGRALSFMAIGGFISSATLPLLNEWMLSQFGWENAWRVWGILLLFLFVPLAFFLVQNRPEDVGLLPDGAKNNKVDLEDHEANKDSESQELLEDNWTLQEALKTTVFWFLLFAVAIPAMVNTGITFHLLSILGQKGMEAKEAAFILSMMAVVAFPIAFVAGFILERVKVHIMLALVFLGEMIFLLVLQNASTFYIAIAFGVIWGIIGGLEGITINIIWPNYFGRKYLGSIRGISMTAMVIGSAFGPLPFGFAYDRFGGYTEIIYFMMLFPIIGMILALLSTPPQKGRT